MSEDKKFQSVLDKAKELETLNFEEQGEFNVSEYYSALVKIAKKNENFKNEEAESVVEQAKEIIVDTYIDELNAKRKTVEDYIRKFNPNSKDVQDMELQDVDKVYAISNYLLNAYIQFINEMEFVFTLSKLEAKWLNKVLTKELAYNGDEIFNFAEMYNNFWKNVQDKMEEDKNADQYTFHVPIKTLLILHHLIKEHKVTGRTHDFTHFQSILFQIAKINKLFNAYNIIIERIKSDREIWGNSIDEVMKVKDPEYQKQVQLMQEEHLKQHGGNVENVTVHPVTDEDLGKS